MGTQIVAIVLDTSVVVGWFVESQSNAYTKSVRRRAVALIRFRNGYRAFHALTVTNFLHNPWPKR